MSTLKKQQIDESYVKNIFQEIYENIEERKKETKAQKDSYFDEWAQFICEPKFKLIKNLVYLLEQKDTKPGVQETIYTIFYFILQINPDVANQIKQYDVIPKKIIEFLIQNKKETGTENMYVVNTLILIFDIEKYKELITEELITILFNSLPKIEEQTSLETLVRILISINSIYNDLDKNLFIQVYHKNKNFSLIGEITLILLNNEKNADEAIKELKCIMNILDKEEKDVFIAKDLEAFIDISLRNLQETENEELRCTFLDTLIRITKGNEFYNIMYKTKEFQDILEDYINNDKVNETSKNKCRKVLRNLAKNLKRKLLIKSGVKPEDIPDDDDEEEEEEGEEGEEEEEEGK